MCRYKHSDEAASRFLITESSCRKWKHNRSNTVLSGGGIGVVTGLMGLACDNMLSAKVILADGRLIVVDNTRYKDLFWALKGAGFYFGVVVEITLKTYPLTIFGTHDGRHWIGNFLYPLE